MQTYELSFLILRSIPEEGLPAVVEKIKSAVAKAGGGIFDEEPPVQIDLAYTMTKTVGTSRYVIDDAYIGWVKFDLPAEALAKEGAEHPVEEIQSALRSIDEILRFLLIKAPRETHFTFARAREKLQELEPQGSEGVETVVEEVVE